MAKRVFTQTFGAACAILERNGKFLLVREQGKGKDSGKWNQPGGWIDVGENPIEAVKREVKEETGFDFEPTDLLGIYSLVRKDHPIGTSFPHPIKLIFIGKFDESNKSALSDDVSENKWFTQEEINQMDLSILRDLDIKKEVRDYLAGKKYPLDLISHTVSE